LATLSYRNLQEDRQASLGKRSTGSELLTTPMKRLEQDTEVFSRRPFRTKFKDSQVRKILRPETSHFGLPCAQSHLDFQRRTSAAKPLRGGG